MKGSHFSEAVSLQTLSFHALDLEGLDEASVARKHLDVQMVFILFCWISWYFSCFCLHVCAKMCSFFYMFIVESSHLFKPLWELKQIQETHCFSKVAFWRSCFFDKGQSPLVSFEQKKQPESEEELSSGGAFWSKRSL